MNFYSKVKSMAKLASCMIIILVLSAACSDSGKQSVETETLPVTQPVFVKKNKRIKIVFFSPVNEEDIFWGLFRDFMQEAVQDLDMDLKVHYAHRDQYRLAKLIRNSIIIDKPDVFILPNMKDSAPHIIKMTNKARIPTLLVNAGLLSNAGMGAPREKYKYWIGEMLPDDEQAGYRLAKKLMDMAKGERIELMALGGHIADTASRDRLKGLRRALRENPSIHLTQIVPMDWRPEPARKKFLEFKQTRYPNLRVVWSASDGMALGAIKGVKELGLKPGRDIIIGGVDWSEQGIESIKKGELAVSLGGHYMEGAWCAVMIYDLFNGKDFATESLRMRSAMQVLDRSNVERYLRKYSRKNWKNIDFRKYSKVLNPSLKKYNFSIQL